MVHHKKIYSSLFSTEKPFNLHETLYSGQSFIWTEDRNFKGYFSGLIGNQILFFQSENENCIKILSTTKELYQHPLSDFLTSFFTLDVDEKALFSSDFQQDYPELWRMVKPYQSVRVMQQNPFEIMVTFMCAQGIGMHLIRRQVTMIAERYGEKIVLTTPDGNRVFHAFPTPLALASAEPNELAMCTNNNRIRAANIIAMARSFDSGKLALACVGSGECELETLRETLCAHGGIGMKIADCIALFGLGRFDAFPIDTHVKQYLWEWFGIEEARRSLTEKNYRILQEKARAILGTEYAGYAGHQLFHCWRKEIKKMKAF